MWIICIINLSLCQKMVTITTEQVWLTWRPQIPQSTVDDKVAILIKLEKKQSKKGIINHLP